MTTLGYVLLAMLAREPRSGYDLTNLLKGSFSFFWHAGHSQIYPELGKLERDGLIMHERIAQQDRPDKKLFSITSAGLEILKVWVIAPPEAQPMRDELVLKAFCLWLVDARSGLALFREREEHYIEQLAGYEAVLVDVERRWREDGHKPTSPWFGTSAILRRGIIAARGNRDWCRWVIEQIESTQG